MPRNGLRRLKRKWLIWFFTTVFLVVSGLLIIFLSEKFRWYGLFPLLIAFVGGGYYTQLLFWQLITWTPTGTDESVNHPVGNGPRIVTIGGGTGLGTILRGLKKVTNNLTAIVTVADDGGSSGRLRAEFGILPPGDIRNCLIAMADLEPLMERLMQYRFNGGTGLSGHSFGNLFITAMTGITGDFEKAIEASSQVLAVKGRVYPATLENVELNAELSDGRKINGESAIGKSPCSIHRVYLEPTSAKALPEAIKAIEEADVVILGPGSLYTSVIPPLLVEGITEALLTTGAPKVYICNVMTQPGETTGFAASDHLRAIIDHTGENIIDYVIINNQPVPEKARLTYAEEGATPVVPDREKVSRLGSVPIIDSLLQTNGLVRHNADRLARLVLGLARVNRHIEANSSPLQRLKRRLRQVATTLIPLFSLGIKTDIVFKEELKGKPIPYEDHCTEGKGEPTHEVLVCGDPVASVSPKEEMLEFFISAGSRPTGGYRLKPVAVSLHRRELYIRYREETPLPGEVVKQVLTYPGLSISIKRKYLPTGSFRTVFEKEGVGKPVAVREVKI